MKVLKRPNREEFVFIRNDETDAHFRTVLKEILRKCKTKNIIIHLENFDDKIHYYLRCKSGQYRRNFVKLAFIFVPIKFYRL